MLAVMVLPWTATVTADKLAFQGRDLMTMPVGEPATSSRNTCAAARLRR
jgi:hypothetical protein